MGMLGGGRSWLRSCVHGGTVCISCQVGVAFPRSFFLSSESERGSIGVSVAQLAPTCRFFMVYTVYLRLVKLHFINSYFIF